MAPVALYPPVKMFVSLPQDEPLNLHPSTAPAPFAFDALQDALSAFARGEFLIVTDDESRENEGDLIIAASHITTEKMAWFIKVTR